MDQFRLKCFIAVAEELNFSRAAARCHISQPAMTQQIQQLEHELQVPLALRTNRSVTLTSAGEAFLEEARRINRALDQAVDHARRAHAGSAGQLSIGSTSPALWVLFPEAVRHFRRYFPDAELHVEEMSTAEQERALRRRDIHIGLAHPPLDDESLACVTVASPQFILAIPDDHPLAAASEVWLPDLVHERLVLFPRQVAPSLYDTIIGACVSAGFSPNIAYEVYPAQSIVSLASAGMGIGMLNAFQQLPRPGVVYRSLSGGSPHLNLGVAYEPDRNSPLIQSFIEAAQQVGKKLDRA